MQKEKNTIIINANKEKYTFWSFVYNMRHYVIYFI